MDGDERGLSFRLEVNNVNEWRRVEKVVRFRIVYSVFEIAEYHDFIILMLHTEGPMQSKTQNL